MGYCSDGLLWFLQAGRALPDTGSTFDPKTDLAWRDLAVDSHTHTRTVKIHLKKSKCDQFGKGVDVYLGRGLGPLPSDSPTSLHRDAGYRTGTIVCGLLTSSHHQTVVHRPILRCPGFPQQEYAGHSFCIGAQRQQHQWDWRIPPSRRWQSAAFLRYVRTPGTQLATLSASLDRRERQPPPPNK